MLGMPRVTGGDAVAAGGASKLGRGAIPVALLGVAGAGWAWSVATAGEMRTGVPAGRMTPGSSDAMGIGGRGAASLAGFMVAWLAMMAAMMLPAVIPVVRLYGLAASRGAAAPVPVFVGGYLAVWGAVGLPVFLVWRALSGPLASGDAWVGYLAAAALLAAAAYQFTPLKTACLRHCRSPLSFFMRQRGDLRAPRTALRMGMSHGLVCLGCCWALMAILVTLGTMQIGAMLLLAALILVEKNARRGLLIARAASAVMAGLAIALLTHPSLISHLG